VPCAPIAQAFGKCGASFMAGYCKATCGKCGGRSSSTSPTAEMTASLYGQCGGMYGGKHCSVTKTYNRRICKDAQWPGTQCGSGTCTRINAAYWQCR